MGIKGSHSESHESTPDFLERLTRAWAIKQSSVFLRYGVAVLAVELVLLLKQLLDPLIAEQSPFLLLSAGVIVAAWFGGFGPGVLATILGAVAANFFFLQPVGSFAGLGAESLPFALFVVQGLLISALVQALRSTGERAEANARAARGHQESLRRSEDLYRTAVEQAAENIYLVDVETKRILKANSALHRSLGYTEEEIQGLTLYDIVAHDRESVDRNTERIVQEGRLSIGERKYRRKDGTWLDMEVNASAISYDGREALCVVAHDVTERKKAEIRFRTLVEQIPAVTYIQEPIESDNPKAITYMSPQYETMLGYPPQTEMIDEEHWLRTLHPEDRARVLAEEVRTDESGEPFKIEYRVIAADGRAVWVRDHAVLVRNKEGEPLYWLGVQFDVTEQKGAEEALRRSLGVLLALREAGRVLGSTLESEEVVSKLLEIMRGVSELTAAVISLQDDEGSLRIWRSAGIQGLWRGIRFTPEAAAARRATLESGERRLFLAPRPDFGAEYLVGLCLPLRSRDRVIGVLEAYGPMALAETTTMDVLGSLASQASTALENAQLYEQLAERERRLHDLVGKLLRAQEEERRLVAYEVHDGLAQIATAAHQHLQVFAARHAPRGEGGQKELERVLQLVRATVSDARRIISNLRPTTLDDLGLVATLSLEVERLREDGYLVHFEEELGDERLPVAAEIALFRVAQEALTNARKHAETRRLYIELRRRGDEVRLEVRDYGRGFNPSAMSAGSGPGERVGLAGMRERINMLDGKLEIQSQQGSGTSVIATLDLTQMP
jgi:PAS domain S-box-containing protein